MSFALNVGHHQIPQPGKKNLIGEDTFYTQPKCIAVFDGVGGWSTEGVDAREYAEKLRDGVKEAYEKRNITDPVELLHYSYENGHSVTGTSTACILVLDGNSVQGANVGDSQFIVVRNLKVIIESEEQQVKFNMPYQIGTDSNMTPRTHAERYDIPVQAGDFIVMGSDGLFDNLQNTAMVNSIKKGGSVTAIAKDIAKKAFSHSRDSHIVSPFAKQAQQHNVVWCGGKPDDITVVVAKVVLSKTRKTRGK